MKFDHFNPALEQATPLRLFAPKAYSSQSPKSRPIPRRYALHQSIKVAIPSNNYRCHPIADGGNNWIRCPSWEEIADIPYIMPSLRKELGNGTRNVFVYQ